MEFFRKKRRFSAVMKRINGKMEKAKDGSGPDGARKKVIEIEFDVELTAKMRELLDPRIAQLLALTDAETEEELELPVNAIDLAKDEQVCILRVYSRANFNKESKPVFTRGGAPDDDAGRLVLKKIVIRNRKAAMILKAKIRFGADAWNWGGDCLGEGECVVEYEPLQLELDLAGKGGEEAPAEAPAEKSKK